MSATRSSNAKQSIYHTLEQIIEEYPALHHYLPAAERLLEKLPLHIPLFYKYKTEGWALAILAALAHINHEQYIENIDISQIALEFSVSKPTIEKRILDLLAIIDLDDTQWKLEGAGTDSHTIQYRLPHAFLPKEPVDALKQMQMMMGDNAKTRLPKAILQQIEHIVQNISTRVDELVARGDDLNDENIAMLLRQLQQGPESAQAPAALIEHQLIDPRDLPDDDPIKQALEALLQQEHTGNSDLSPKIIQIKLGTPEEHENNRAKSQQQNTDLRLMQTASKLKH